MRVTLNLLGCLALFAMAVSAADWPRFRGPNGGSVSTATRLPAEFGPGKNMAWKAEVPFGRSSPVVAGGRIFLTASESDRLITLAYDVATGKQVWRKEAAKKHKHELYRANDAASPTPAVDDSQVYVFFPDLGLIAYDFQGNEKWRHALGPFQSFYGLAASPIVVGDLVILVCDQEQRSFLLAVDKKTGRQRWRAERPEAGIGWAVPAIYQNGNSPAELIVLGSTRVDSYYAATGESRWWTPIVSDGVMGSALILGERLIVHGRGYDEPWVPPLEATWQRLDKDGDRKLSRAESKDEKEWYEHFGYVDANHDGFIDAAEWTAARNFGVGDYGVLSITPGQAKGRLPVSAVNWRFKRNTPYIPAPVVWDGVLFMVKSGGIVTSLNPATGEMYKQGRSPEALGSYSAQPVAADGKVYIVSEEGKLSVLKAAAQWEVLHVANFGEECFATPAITDDGIFVRTRSALYRFPAEIK